MRRYFIIGTDTDCGKTYVTCELLEYFKNKSQKIMAVKPIASGCIEMEGQLVSEDVIRLQHHNSFKSNLICPWRFKRPISPHLAAKESGQEVSAQQIADFCNQTLFGDIDYLLVEGAGGLMCPLNDSETWVDFLLYSKIPVILVVGLQLGCLNHALLSQVALQVHQIDCVGWIANCIDKNMLALSENIDTLSKKMAMPLLATIAYGGKFEGDVIKHLLF